jgi:hypothetical protein
MLFILFSPIYQIKRLMSIKKPQPFKMDWGSSTGLINLVPRERIERSPSPCKGETLPLHHLGIKVEHLSGFEPETFYLASRRSTVEL